MDSEGKTQKDPRLVRGIEENGCFIHYVRAAIRELVRNS
jgi:hypothetical protein